MLNSIHDAEMGHLKMELPDNVLLLLPWTLWSGRLSVISEQSRWTVESQTHSREVHHVMLWGNAPSPTGEMTSWPLECQLFRFRSH